MHVRRTIAVILLSVLAVAANAEGGFGQVSLPAGILAGDCDGQEPVVDLTDIVTAGGATVGSLNSVEAANSFSTVPLSLDLITSADHALLVTAPDGSRLACGAIGGVLTDSNSLIFGLFPIEDSGVSGVAVLSPSADPSQVNLSVFVAPVSAPSIADSEDAGSSSEQVDDPLAAIGESDKQQAEEPQVTTEQSGASYDSGGLGLTVAAWQKIHGPGTPGPLGLTYNDGEYWAQSGEGGKLVHIEQELPPMTVEEARTLSLNLMPTDAQFVGSYVAEFGLLVDLYYSPSLIEQLPNDDWTNAQPGNFIVIYGQYGPPTGSGPVTDLLVATGNNP